MNKLPAPPRWADRLLEWRLPDHLLEEIQGDLHERFHKRVKVWGEKEARKQYAWEALGYLLPRQGIPLNSKDPSTAYFTPNYPDMLQNYFKIALRNLLRHRAFTFINVSGLSLGMACCLLLVLFIQYELSYDTFNDHYDRIYRLVQTNGNGSIKTPFPTAKALVNEFPEVQKAGRLFPHQDVPVQFDEQSFVEKNIYAADQDILDIFTFQLTKGKRSEVLKAPNSLVITEEMASKYFRDAEPLGKILLIFDKPMKITGVMKSLPANAHFHPNMLVAYSSFPEHTMDFWGWTDPRTYFLLKEGAQVVNLNRKLPDMTQRHDAAWMSLKAQPLADIHLRSNMRGELEPNGSVTYLYVTGLIALFILGIACINFMNLSSARASRRAKEVGVRKVMGAFRQQLVFQFLGESLLLTFISAVLALLITLYSIPFLNELTSRSISFHYTTHLFLLASMLGIVMIVGIGSGLYPALYLSAFKPIAVLKGGTGTKGTPATLRRALVVFQFAVTILLMVGTLTVLDQLQFIQTKNLGFNQNQVVIIPLRGSKATEKTNALLQTLKQRTNILQVAAASNYPGVNHTMLGRWVDDRKEPAELYAGSVGFNYDQTMEMSMREGRFFSDSFKTDLTDAVVINEEAARLLGLEHPIGRKVYDSSPDNKERRGRTIIGVVKNFHSRSLRETIEPLILYPCLTCSHIIARVEVNNLAETIAGIEKDFKKVIPLLPFEASFLDQEFAQTYDEEKRLASVVKIFTGLAIFISCLGLFGLISYTIDQKTKEIGIRKVLGASVEGIVFLLFRESARYVFIAIGIATPVSYFVMTRWLEGYTYRASLSWTVFVIAGVSALLIAFLTIAYQAIKAALANPIKSLRTE